LDQRIHADSTASNVNFADMAAGVAKFYKQVVNVESSLATPNSFRGLFSKLAQACRFTGRAPLFPGLIPVAAHHLGKLTLKFRLLRRLAARILESPNKRCFSAGIIGERLRGIVWPGQIPCDQRGDDEQWNDDCRPFD
jgi:hypothetical protein